MEKESTSTRHASTVFATATRLSRPTRSLLLATSLGWLWPTRGWGDRRLEEDSEREADDDPDAGAWNEGAADENSQEYDPDDVDYE